MTIFSGGNAISGGAIFWKALLDAKAYISDTAFFNNWSGSSSDFKNSNGGAFYIDQITSNLGAEINLISTSFENNFAYTYGGAIFASISWNKFIVNADDTIFINNIS